MLSIIIEMMEAYKKDKDFKEYVDRYATKHRMLPEDCLAHKMVQELYLDKYKEE